MRKGHLCSSDWQPAVHDLRGRAVCHPGEFVLPIIVPVLVAKGMGLTVVDAILLRFMQSCWLRWRQLPQKLVFLRLLGFTLALLNIQVVGWFLIGLEDGRQEVLGVKLLVMIASAVLALFLSRIAWPMFLLILSRAKRWVLEHFPCVDDLSRSYYKRRRASDSSGKHLRLGLTMNAMQEVLHSPDYEVQLIRESGEWVKDLSWMSTEWWWKPDAKCLYGYEVCLAARMHVREEQCPDHSEAELLYIKGDRGADWSNVFLSHAQLETVEETLAAILSYDIDHPGTKYFVDFFCIRQGIKGDFKVDLVRTVIQQIGNTQMVAQPWQSPETLKRIWCVFELYCTIDGDANFEIIFTEQSRLTNMLRRSKSSVDSQTEIFQGIVNTLSSLDVTKAQARNEEDRVAILEKIQNGPGVLRTNVAVVARTMQAMEQVAAKALKQPDSKNVAQVVPVESTGKGPEAALQAMEQVAARP